MTLDEKTFEEFYYRYSGRLERFAERFVGDSKISEDIVSESFISLWEKYHSKDIGNCNSLIYRIVRNRCLTTLRHRFTEGEIHLENRTPGEEMLYSLDIAGDGADSSTLYHELEEAITMVFDSLSPQCRKVFKMSRIEGLKNREIAERLGISEKAVEKHISKALKAFRAEFPESSEKSTLIYFLIFMALSDGTLLS